MLNYQLVVIFYCNLYQIEYKVTQRGQAIALQAVPFKISLSIFAVTDFGGADRISGGGGGSPQNRRVGVQRAAVRPTPNAASRIPPILNPTSPSAQVAVARAALPARAAPAVRGLRASRVAGE